MDALFIFTTTIVTLACVTAYTLSYVHLFALSLTRTRVYFFTFSLFRFFAHPRTYVRFHFSKLLAKSLGLDEIWMVDDNVERCWTIEMDAETDVPKPINDVVQLRPCGFSSLMQGMELVLDNGKRDELEEKLPGETVRFSSEKPAQEADASSPR